MEVSCGLKRQKKLGCVCGKKKKKLKIKTCLVEETKISRKILE
jgi:hypothetical protein